jgi:signal transduction histidine kinase/CheY-like chemotaxis protein
MLLTRLKEVLMILTPVIFLSLGCFYFFDIPLIQLGFISLFCFFYVLFFFYRYRRPALIKEVEPKESDTDQILKKELQLITKKAEDLEGEIEATGMFLASMSHEIRTPLNGIVGLTELLDGTKLTDEQKEFVSMIRESSNNLTVIVNDVLDVSKMNADKMELESISFDIFKKIESSVGMFVSKIDTKEIDLNIFIDPKIPKILIGDPTRLSQVIINLVSNAVKFTDTNGKISVYAEYLNQNNNDITFKVSVSDSGIGLTKEQQSKIFEAYGQADASTTRKSGGTGLGLTISSKIIDSMGSKLNVESEEGKGSTFFFTLTLKADEHNEQVNYAQFKGMRVGLILPDKTADSALDTIFEKYVQHLGAIFKRYYNADLFESNSNTVLPDILIVDYNHVLPEEELKRFSELNCKCVLMTSSNLQSYIESERYAFEKIVYTPVTLEKVINILQLSIENREPTIVKQKTKVDDVKEFNDIHVLVAEDNPINQKLIKIVLENFGLKVSMASNGEEAYELRKKENYDMIFMDIQMPVMNGIEATQVILKYEE